MSRAILLLLQVLVAAVAIGLWYVLTTYEIFGVMVLPPFFFSTPVDVADRIVRLFAGGTIWKHLWVTLSESMLAFAIGSIAGVLVGFWFARKPAFAAVFDPYVKMINALPRVVLAPIFTLWFGLGIWSKVALGVTLVFFIVFFNVYQGVKEVSPTVLANARMLGMGERALMRHVYWPSALSWMFSSLHTAVGFAVVGAVVGEYLGSAAAAGRLVGSSPGNPRAPLRQSSPAQSKTQRAWRVRYCAALPRTPSTNRADQAEAPQGWRQIPIFSEHAL
jgi:NitT/TauT family transport system permease protein